MLSFAEKVQKLHNCGLYHRDIKGDNFLYSKNNQKGYLIDFGLCEIDSENKEDQSIYPEHKKLL